MKTAQHVEECDYLILGGGSAGCVMASRLSEDPSVRVILVEAGNSPSEGPDADIVRDARFRTYGNPRLVWSTVTAKYTGSGPTLPFSQAKVLGGGSAINGMHCQRGLPTDYDEWSQLGVTGWNWEQVLPYFKKVEADQDFPGGDHGSDGPLKIGRIGPEKWSGLTRGIAEALRQQGLKELRDLNIDEGDGYGAVPLNLNNGARHSTADAYLTAAVRGRPNLSILTGATAQRLMIDASSVAGAEVDDRGRNVAIRAAETVLCMGAIHSPAFLLRSGIGPAADLAAAGLPTVADRPGVGANLANHPLLTLGAHLKRAGRQSRAVAHPCPMLVRYSSGVPGCPSTDMTIDVWERTPNQLNWDPIAAQIANLMLILNKVYSTGVIKLQASRELDVSFNLLSDYRDLERMMGGVLFLGQFLSQPSVRKLVNRAFFPAYFSPLVYKLMQNDMQAQLLSIAGAIGLSTPAFVRDRFLDRAGRNLSEVLADSDALREEVLRSVLPGGHVAGTCRMGNPAQKATVLDSRCRVVGVDGLRVVDASIFPTLMAAGTNLPVMMAAEKVSDMMTKDRRS
ncbi:GMC family oxidoreductase [Sphingobium sp. EM0848]|uniref:GMC family oxidoreductase n=1 Tax=Sphingobium sp. EM0848 TaxID=2743473 RepID=UPI00159C375C|nr:GMC family oxidoreductase [Sphingobium sp. EM0848]